MTEMREIWFNLQTFEYLGSAYSQSHFDAQ